mmetsp:Transcript_73398/g.118416  ORF Transcript_73398/g.118416 Transcript_73398/m.118416 type:complete len:384 (+) Transcript_73398:25-1176(+)
MKSTFKISRLVLLSRKAKCLQLRKCLKSKTSKSSGSRAPLVHRSYWKDLPNWIALHAERGPHRKCWEGHRLRLERQDGRRHGPCKRCNHQPLAGTPVMFCQTCSWGRCLDCLARSRLPRLAEDPLFYGPSNPCLLKPVYSDKAMAGRGTVIICPGGNYEFLCPNEGLPVAAWLVRHGIQAMVLRYRLLPKHNLSDALADLEAAVANVRRHRGGPVACVGFSAGGHLVASLSQRLGQQKGRTSGGPLDAQVLVYPCIDGEEWLDPERDGFWDKENCQPKAPSLLAGRAALLGGKGFAAPPTFMVASTADSVCPPKAHSDRYIQVLKRRKIDNVYLRGDFGDHGFGLDKTWTSDCIPWLNSQGFGSAAGAGRTRSWAGHLLSTSG